MTILTLDDFLLWASTPAGMVAIGASLSIALRDIEWFGKLSKSQKSSVMLILNTILIPIVVVYIPSILSPAAMNYIRPMANAIILGCVSYLTGQLAHEKWNKKILKSRKVIVDNVPSEFLGFTANNDPVNHVMDTADDVIKRLDKDFTDNSDIYELDPAK